MVTGYRGRLADVRTDGHAGADIYLRGAVCGYGGSGGAVSF